MVGRIGDRRLITYGFNPQADARLVDLDADGGGSQFTRAFRDRAGGPAHEIADLTLPMPGRHNALNATAAIAVARELGISDEQIRKGLAGFGGVKRRFTRTGEWNGVDGVRRLRPPSGRDRRRAEGRARVDQGPGDRRGAAASLHAARALFDQFCTCFNDADTVIVAQVYAAGEAPIEGVDRDALVAGMRARGHRDVIALDDAARSSPASIKGIAQAGRLRRVPRRRQHHAMGLCAAGKLNWQALAARMHDWTDDRP